MAFPGGSDGKESAYNVGDLGWIPGSDPWIGKILRRREWLPSQAFLPERIPWMEEPGRL